MQIPKAELGHLIEPIKRELAKHREVELVGTRPNTKPDILAPNDAEVTEVPGKL